MAVVRVSGEKGYPKRLQLLLELESSHSAYRCMMFGKIFEDWRLRIVSWRAQR